MRPLKISISSQASTAAIAAPKMSVMDAPIAPAALIGMPPARGGGGEAVVVLLSLSSSSMSSSTVAVPFNSRTARATTASSDLVSSAAVQVACEGRGVGMNKGRKQTQRRVRSRLRTTVVRMLQAADVLAISSTRSSAVSAVAPT